MTAILNKNFPPLGFLGTFHHGIKWAPKQLSWKIQLFKFFSRLAWFFSQCSWTNSFTTGRVCQALGTWLWNTTWLTSCFLLLLQNHHNRKPVVSHMASPDMDFLKKDTTLRVGPPDQAPVPLSIFRSNSKFDENSERSSFEYTRPITTIFCTRHDSDTVVTCAKYRCDRWYTFYNRVFWIFIEFRIRSKYA